MAHGDVQIARREGRILPLATGIDRNGVPSADPAAILDGGALSPFGGHKGSSIALMVEVLAAALTGGEFGFEDAADQVEGAVTSRGGQFYIVINPNIVSGHFASRVATLLARIDGNGSARIPGSRRERNRIRTREQGIELPADAVEMLERLDSCTSH